MTPRTYVDTIVLPTVREALEHRGDRRLNYLACIAVLHILDHLAGGSRRVTGQLQKEIRALCGPSMDIVQGIANGTKHAGETSERKIAPGSERDVLPFGFGPGFSGFDEGRWDHAGLAISVSGGAIFLDLCTQVVLLAICAHHEQALGEVDLGFLDEVVRRGPPEPWSNYWGEGMEREDWLGGLRGRLH